MATGRQVPDSGSGRLAALGASVRLANLPSVISNIWLGVAIGAWCHPPTSQDSFWPTVGWLMGSGVALYGGGNFLNDWYDRHWDACHRPERALPRGLFPPGWYLGLGLVLVGLGVTLAGHVSLASGGVAAAILLGILGYTRWHKRAAAGIVPLALCRALLPLLFLSQWPQDRSWAQDWHATPMAANLLVFSKPVALLLYTAAISMLARGESTGSPAGTPPLRALALWFLSAVAMSVLPPQVLPFAVAGLVPYLAWLLLTAARTTLPVSRRVGSLLAGFPLLDWVAILPLALFGLNHAGANPVTLVSLLLPPVAFLSAIGLQRWLPAT